MLNKSILVAINLLFIIPNVISVEWPYRDCAQYEIRSLRVDPCPDSPCAFRAGQVVNITVEFVANQDTDSVKLYGSLKTGGLFGLTIPYTGMDENACNTLYDKTKLDCPLKKGNTYKFLISQTVPYASRFNIFRYTTWKLVADSGADLTCAEFDITQDIALNRVFSQFAE